MTIEIVTLTYSREISIDNFEIGDYLNLKGPFHYSNNKYRYKIQTTGTHHVKLMKLTRPSRGFAKHNRRMKSNEYE